MSRLWPRARHLAVTVSTSESKVGSANSANRVDVIKPPIITIASGRSSSRPWARDSTSGRRPSIAHPAVISFGLNGVSGREALHRSRLLLERLHLLPREDMYLASLSGGEQQRLAVARALVNRPRIILADEPTAAFDTEHGRAVMDLLRQLGREEDAAVIVVTHDQRMIEGFNRVFNITDGRVDVRQPAAFRDAALLGTER